MGIKIKAGMALGGLILSWAFGLNFLSGIAGYIDSTGNILVDIADGIGLVSQGIETLEGYLDTSKSKPADEDKPPPVDPSLPLTIGDAPPPAATPETATPTPSQAPPPPPPQPKPVICKKGKCAPYDPSKDRFLQQQLIKAERERILQQVKQGALPADTVLPRLPRSEDDEEEDEDDEEGFRIRRIRVPKQSCKTPPAPPAAAAQAPAPQAAGAQNPAPTAQNPSPAQTAPGAPNPASPQSQSSAPESQSRPKTPTPEILNPESPELPLLSPDSDPPSGQESGDPNPPEDSGPEESRWRFGLRKILGSTAGLCSKLNTLLLKVVTTIFPWNRRARRRLAGDSAEDDM